MAKFKKGESGNPGGRRKQDPAFKARAKELSLEALEILAKHMRNTRRANASVKAAIAVIEHGEGKATLSVKHSGQIDSKLAELDKMSTEQLIQLAREQGVKT
jgi:hypothetical protein